MSCFLFGNQGFGQDNPLDQRVLVIVKYFSLKGKKIQYAPCTQVGLYTKPLDCSTSQVPDNFGNVVIKKTCDADSAFLVVEPTRPCDLVLNDPKEFWIYPKQPNANLIVFISPCEKGKNQPNRKKEERIETNRKIIQELTNTYIDGSQILATQSEVDSLQIQLENQPDNPELAERLRIEMDRLKELEEAMEFRYKRIPSNLNSVMKDANKKKAKSDELESINKKLRNAEIIKGYKELKVLLQSLVTSGFTKMNKAAQLQIYEYGWGLAHVVGDTEVIEICEKHWFELTGKELKKAKALRKDIEKQEKRKHRAGNKGGQPNNRTN